MKSNLIFRKPKKGKRPSAIRLTLQIDEVRMWLDGSADIENQIYDRLNEHLGAWEDQMQNQKSDEPVF